MARPRQPEHMTSPVLGGLISGVLAWAAEAQAALAEENGKSAISGALVTVIARAGQEIDDWHKATGGEQ